MKKTFIMVILVIVLVSSLHIDELYNYRIAYTFGDHQGAGNHYGFLLQAQPLHLHQQRQNRPQQRVQHRLPRRLRLEE